MDSQGGPVVSPTGLGRLSKIVFTLWTWQVGWVVLSLGWFAAGTWGQAEETYRIQPRDTLEITVLDEEQYSRKATVLPDGRMSYPRLGVLKVSGLTVAELEEKIREAVAQEVRDPQVSIAVTPSELPQVYVLGEVNQPGPVDFVEGGTLLHYLGQAGGPTEKAGLEQVILMRRPPVVESLMVNLEAVLSRKAEVPQIVIRPGDTVMVPLREAKVYVSGQVRTPGPVDYRPERMLSDYLGLAGGPTERAWLSEAQLIRRDGQQIRLDLTGLRQPGFSLPEVALAPGDTLSLPENVQKVYVQGEVRQPGAFDYRPELALSDYLGLAGGPTPTAWLGGARLRQVGAAKEQILDLSRPEGGKAVMVGPGDVLSVPTNWQRVNVVGEVNKPGAYPWREGARLSDYLGEAGGVTENAWLTQATLTRAAVGDAAAEVRSVDLATLLQGTRPDDNIVLQPGDTLQVPLREAKVYVVGQVRTPGPIDYRPEWKLSDYLGRAGGFTEQAWPAQAQWTKSNGERVLLDLGSAQNPTLEPGDTVYVPLREAKVYVSGQVRTPGPVDYRPERKLSDYLGLAGGPTERAWLSEAQLIRRDGQQIRLDLTGLRQPGFSLPEVVLAPGDTLSLPENVQKVYVQGEVRQPGAFDYRPGLTVADYLGLAGGPTPTAWLREARLRKAGGPQEQILDLDRPRDLVDAVMVGPGDVLSVPTKWHRVNVVGEVSKPGAIPWREGARLLDYLGEAGGVTENAWLNQATLTRAAAGDAAAEVRTVDLAALLHGAKPEDNLVLQPGDTLSVSPKLQNVYVLGEVVNPGAYEYRPGQTVADYLGLAGGPTPEALRSQATLTREVEGTRTVTTFSLEESEKDHLSLVLSPSDTIYLPRNVLKVNVVGEVHRPGEFEFRKGLRLSDYVAQAGGPTDLAKTSEVRIARGQGQDRQVFKVDLGKALKGKDPESNPELQAGDTVTVPQRAIARWTEVTNLLDVFFRFGLLWWLRR